MNRAKQGINKTVMEMYTILATKKQQPPSSLMQLSQGLTIIFLQFSAYVTPFPVLLMPIGSQLLTLFYQLFFSILKSLIFPLFLCQMLDLPYLILFCKPQTT